MSKNFNYFTNVSRFKVRVENHKLVMKNLIYFTSKFGKRILHL